MKKIVRVMGLAVTSLGVLAAQEVAPQHEVGLTLGGLMGSERNGGATRLDLGTGVALEANYGYRFLAAGNAAIYGEVQMLANPLRDIAATDQSLTRNVATLFVTPGIRVKVLPLRRIAPYFAIGGGWADYEQSTTTLAGRPNPAPRRVNHGAFDYGGGVDIRWWRIVGLRGEVRDFYAGAPSYNSTSLRGGRHNVVAGGGIVLHFH